MPTAFSNPSKREQALTARISELVGERIKELGYQEVAPRLGLLPIGVKNWCWRSSSWTLSEAFRAADALGLDVVAEIEKAAGIR